MTTPHFPSPPYTVQASCELSQDYFLTTDIVMQGSDEVIPFINPYLKQVEAIVFSPSANDGKGAVNHLQRDPAASTGWKLVPVDYTANLITATYVAVADNGSTAYLMIYSADTEITPVWLTELTSAAAWDTTGVLADAEALGLIELGLSLSTPLGPFKGGVDPAGHPYFYAAATDTSSQTALLIAWTSDDNEINYQLLQTLDLSTSDPLNGPVADYQVLFDSAGGPHPVGYSLILRTSGFLEVFLEQPYTNPNAPQFTLPLLTSGAAGVTALLAAWATPGRAPGVPGFAYQTADATWFSPEDEENPRQSLADHPVQAPNSVAVWTGDLSVVNLLDANDTLNTVLETAPGTWQAPIPTVPGPVVPGAPTVPGLKSVFGVPTDLTQSTLFAIGLDDTLSVLTLDEAGWTQTLVRQDGNTSQPEDAEISSYRVQVNVLDANGLPVPGASVEVGTDRPVGFWQPSGGSYLTPAAPVTLTTDYSGKLVFSVPAEELDCAVLTVQALDASSHPAGSPLIVTADTDVRGFLDGSGMLTDLGTINGGNALLQAKNSAGGDLFPGLSALSGDTQAQAVKQSAQALSTFIAAGTKTTPADGTQSLQLNMSNGVPTVSASTAAFAFGPAPSPGDLQLGLSLSHLFDTIGHALRHAAAKLASVTAHFVDEATGWVISIGAEIAGAVQNFTNLVISDMKDAFHAIGGFFQALGADILEGLQWLKHNVLELLKAAWDNGQQIATFIGSAPAAFSSQVNTLSFKTDTFFTDLADKAHGLISTAENAVTGETLAKAPQQTSPPGTGSSGAQSGLAKDFGLFTKVINDTPGMWLWHKLEQDVPSVATLQLPTFTQGDYTVLVNQLGVDWTAGKDFIESVWTFMTTTFQDLFGTTSAQARQTDLPTVFSTLDQMVENFLKFCDQVAQTILDMAKLALGELSKLLTKPFQLVSSTSLLGQILDMLGINVTVQLDEIMGMIIAFPATLVAEALGKGNTMPELPALPVSSTALAEAAGVSDEVKLWLGILGGTSQAIWGLADIIGDLQTFTDAETGKRGEQSGIITMFDIFCPMFETGFLYPLPPYGELEWAIAPIVLTALLPSIFGAFGLQDWDGLTAKLQPQVGDKAAMDAMASYVQPVVQTLSGAANTALGISYQVENGDKYWVDILGTVLGNLSFILAISGTVWLNETTEDIPVMVKMLIDAIGNVGAAICIYESNSLPPK